MKRLDKKWLGIVACVMLGASGCEDRKSSSGELASSPLPLPSASAPGAPTTDAPADENPSKKGSRPAPQVRVSVVVLPGDAEVEVDGVKVRRRNGLIELVGAVGDVRRIRAFWGTKATREESVILNSQGTYAKSIDATDGETIDVNGRKPSRPVVNINE